MRLYSSICGIAALVAMFWQLRMATGLFVKLSGVVCSVADTSFVTFPVCKLKAVDRLVSEMSVTIELKQKPVTNASIRVQFLRRGYAHLPIIDYSVDICTFLANKRRKPIANHIYRLMNLKKYSNIKETCPFDYDIVVDKYRFNQNDVSLLPFGLGHYQMVTIWFAYQQLRANVTINMDVREKP